MKIAITGPTGSIGSDIVESALERGYEVIAIVRPGSNRLSNIKNREKIKIIECDISDYRSLFNKEKCDMFFHLSWMNTNVNNRDDICSQIDNVRFTMDAIELAHSWGSNVFVGAGSQAEYGPQKEQITNNTNEHPESGYGIAKYTSQMFGKLLCRKLQMRFCWTRILSVFGKCDAQHTIMQYLVRTLLSGESPEMTKCEQIWDFMYSKDAAEALLDVGLRGVNEKIYPIASGTSCHLYEYVDKVKDLIDPKIEIKYGAKDYYPHQPMILSADMSEMMSDTGFSCKYSFEEGIKEVIDYVKKQKA